MPAALVQQTANQGANVSSLTLTLPANATAGNLLLLSFEYTNIRTATVAGIGATWTRIAQNADGNGNLYDIWKGTGNTGGAAAVTITFSAGGVYPGGNLSEFSGVSNMQAGSGTNVTGTTVTSPARTTDSGGLVYAVFGFPDTATATYTDAPSAWTALTSVDVTAGAIKVAPAFRVPTSAADSSTRQLTASASGALVAVSAASTPTGSSVAAALTAARTARTFSLTAAVGHVVAAALTAARVARGFTATASPTQNGRLTAGRTARGFTIAADANLPATAGRPDADTAAGWGRLDREFSLTLDVEPPVDPTPAAYPSRLYRRASYSYTAPTVAADGWSNPKQTRTLIDGSIVGRHRIKFNGVDRTYYRGVPARLVEEGHANPFGPEIAVFHFPQVSPFEAPPTWLNDGAKVVVTLVDGSDVTVPGWAWIGYVHNRTPELGEDSWGTTVEAKGFLYQGDDEINKPNPTAQGGAAVPIGYRVADVLNAVIGRRFPRIARVDTSPSITRSRGSLSQTVVGFVRDLFGAAWTTDSRQWTALDVAGVMKAQIVLPDPSVVDYTLSAGQDGVTFDLHEEQDEQPNVVYGEWVDPSGGRHQRLKFPRLHEDKSPAYPLAVGSVFNPGAATTGFQPFSDWMRRNGFSQFDSQDTYLASDTDDVKAAQTRMGITADGVVGAQTWGTAFNTGADVGDLRNAIYLPLAWLSSVEPYLYAPDGAKVGKNPSYDPTVRRKETYVNFGEGLTYREVRRSAQQIVTRNTTGTNLVGQIIVKGSDFEECSKLVARAGKTLRFRYIYGSGTAGVKFHVARIHRTYADDGTVVATLDVDTKWRDAYTVAQIIERNKAARDDPARSLRRHQTSSMAQDTKVQFDADDVGKVYRHNVQGGFWRIVEFPAASWGTFVHVTAVTSPATEFALMLFSQEITARDLDRLVGNPLSAAHPYNANGTALKAAGLIQAWGSSDQPCGYSKTNAATGYKSDSDPLTGRLEYDSGVDFAPANGASLFLAEWCTASTVIAETLELQPVAV